MPEHFQSTLIKVLFPLVGIIAPLLISKKRGISPTGDLRIVWPSAKQLAMWVGAWLLWMWVSEKLIDLFGIPDPTPWPAYSDIIVFMRILAIGMLGPIAEELIFRGLIYFRLSRTRVGTAGAIVIISAAWAAMHVQYGLPMIGMIFVDGLILGTARWSSASVITPMIMHVLANLFSISQSLTTVH